MAGETKSLGQKDKLDKFYTKENIAKDCVDFIKKNIDETDILFIEPAAGNGVFLKYLDKYIAFDISPEAPNIIQADWFEIIPNSWKRLYKAKIQVVIGNPPFGVQNKLAIDFFNQAALSADYIAFILPRSFRKDSIKNRLNRNFHLLNEFILPKKSFLFKGEEYDVNCVFQIWKKEKELRPLYKKKTKTPYFIFTKNKEEATCSIRRVGAAAGKVSEKTDCSEQSNYFLINTSKMSDKDFITFLSNLQYENAEDSVGPKSLSKTELIEVFEEEYINKEGGF